MITALGLVSIDAPAKADGSNSRKSVGERSDLTTTATGEAPREPAQAHGREGAAKVPRQPARPYDAEPIVPCGSDTNAAFTPLRRVTAVGAAIVPGVVVHGTGHWVARQPCTARRIANSELVGLTGIVAGGTTIVFSGASRYLMLPAISLTIGGFGLFITGFAADVYGASGAAKYAGAPSRKRPRWQTEVGVMRVYNPHFDFDWFVTQKVASNLAWGGISAALDTALDGTHARYQFGAALRPYGPRPDLAARDGSYFDLYFGLSEQRYVTSGFVTDTGEMLATGRLDLERVGPSLRGSFAELSAGVALARTRYELMGLSVPADFESLLLGRIAFGVYLGRGMRRGSEVSLYYDHRHDDYAAGLKIPGLGSGNVGHFGLNARYFWSERFGAGTFVEAGSAYVAALSLLFRAGGSP